MRERGCRRAARRPAPMTSGGPSYPDHAGPDPRAAATYFTAIDGNSPGNYHDESRIEKRPRAVSGELDRTQSPQKRALGTMYKADTRGISVTVEPRFVEEESSPSESQYFFAYTVEIVNNGAEQVQLRSRHWRIIDGRGDSRR